MTGSRFALAFSLLLALGCRPSVPAAPASTPTPGAAPAAAAPVAPDPQARAQALARRVLVLDGHVDLPFRLHLGRGPDGRPTEDVSRRTDKGDFDWERAREGGLDAPFMSIYVPSDQETKGQAKRFADGLIDLVEGLAAAHPDKFALARTPDDVRRNFAAARISLPMGMENGAPLEGKLENVAYFHGRGIRYITLTHARDNHISDSSFDDRRTHKGLSPFGKRVVAEMNRVGIMIDVSHVSDDAFWQVMELSKVPVIASHSSCRHFTPGFHRNMSDDMLRALGKNGGVIQINFGSGFLKAEIQADHTARRQAAQAFMKQHGITDFHDPRVHEFGEKYRATHPELHAALTDVADHVEHVVAVAGVDHVGLGSDFDGVGDSLPVDLEDVSRYPNLFRVLLERGWSEADVEKLASANVLRVWQAAEDAGRAGSR